jgi:hypothetical protein
LGFRYETHHLLDRRFFLVGLVLTKFSPQSGFTSLIRIGNGWESRQLSALQALPVATVADSSGYDGQFYAQIALDPLLRDPDLVQSLDAPAYRARRILAPAAAALLGLGNPWGDLASLCLDQCCLLVSPWLDSAPLHRMP